MLIGPRTNLSNGLIGGATVSFEQLITYVVDREIPHDVINTKAHFGRFSGWRNHVHIVIDMLRKIKKAQVIFLNSSRGGARFLAPWLFIIARFLNKKFIFRPFGGNLLEYTDSYGRLSKFIIQRTTFRADLLFLQSKILVEHFLKTGHHAIHLPTSRIIPDEKLRDKHSTYAMRFVYIGAIMTAKGINEILEASKYLSKAYTVHLYGPIVEQKYESVLKGYDGIYRGIVQPEDVLSTISNYDVLLLPTVYEGEGYPGVIIEAYSLGMPVITTKWRSIPEIVEHGKTGRLVMPGSSQELLEAILHFNTSNYGRYSRHAEECFEMRFERDKVLDDAMQHIYRLAES